LTGGRINAIVAQLFSHLATQKVFITGEKLMISRVLVRKLIVTVVTVAVLTVYSMVAVAAPGATTFGELSASGQVTVNGEAGIPNGTVFSGSMINTGPQGHASVTLNELGLVALAPGSGLELSFTDRSIAATLGTGQVQVSTLAGTSVNVQTVDTTVLVDGTQQTTFTVNASTGSTQITVLTGMAQVNTGGTVRTVNAGESASSGTAIPQPTPGTPGNHHGVGGGALAVLLLAAGGVIAAAIIAATQNNDFNFGGNPIIVSPTR
jgi:hypothetical protein